MQHGDSVVAAWDSVGAAWDSVGATWDSVVAVGDSVVAAWGFNSFDSQALQHELNSCGEWA